MIFSSLKFQPSENLQFYYQLNSHENWCTTWWLYDTEIINCFGIVQEEKLPYAFYISDQELLVSLGAYLEKNKGY